MNDVRISLARFASMLMIIIGFCLNTNLSAVAASTNAVTIAMSLSPLSAPVIIAADKGYFDKHGVDVTIKDYVGGFRTIKALLAGSADMATSSEAVVMFNSFKRRDFSVICTFVTSDNDVKIIARKDANITGVKDLKGKRVGTVTGASAQFFLDETLFSAGIDSSDVEVVHINPENLSTALAAGEIDAMVVWEPHIYKTRKKLGDTVVLVPHEKVYTETFNFLSLRDFADKNPTVLEGMVKALIEASNFINANGDEAQQIIANRIDKNIEMINAVWADYDFGISLHQWFITTLEAEARWAIDRQLVTHHNGMPNYLDFLHLETLTRISPSTVTVFK